ncbi:MULTISPECIES: cupredoxin domain-containing protein [Xenorhabdus]|uniref:cupredoxin domain-containing protein n=1 Tax=Xenorhabdus TaxID=626 RepID=UPI00237ACE4F|nr:cupredoxin domain-containing protein [Xenorhabdus ehlersii]
MFTLCISVVSLIYAPMTIAAEKFTLELEMNNGELTPPILSVPAKTPVRIKIRNTGTEPVEFESTQLRKEKVLAPGANSVVVIAPLKPGKYTFFDDFHLAHPAGEIIAE